MNKITLIVGQAIGIIATLLAVKELHEKFPVTVYLLVPTIFVILIYPLISKWMNRIFGIYVLSREVHKLSNIIQEKKNIPTVLVSFDRSSSIIASMVAQNLGISQVLSFNRLSHEGDTARSIYIGHGISLDPDYFND